MSGVASIMAGQMTWTLGAELAPRAGLPDDPCLAAGIGLLSGGAILLIVAVLHGDLGRTDLLAVSETSRIGFIWFNIIAADGFTAFGYLTQNVAPSVATTFSYLDPVIGDTLERLLFHEPLTPRMLLATATIIGGVCLIIATNSERSGRTRHSITSGHGYRVW